MKYLVLISLLLAVLTLFSGEAEPDSLDLGKIVIEGEVEMGRDSLMTLPEMEQFNKIK